MRPSNYVNLFLYYFVTDYYFSIEGTAFNEWHCFSFLFKLLFCNIYSDLCTKFSCPEYYNLSFLSLCFSLFHSDSISVLMYSLAIQNTITKPVELSKVFDRFSPYLWFLQLTFRLFNSHYQVKTTRNVQAIIVLETTLKNKLSYSLGSIFILKRLRLQYRDNTGIY